MATESPSNQPDPASLLAAVRAFLEESAVPNLHGAAAYQARVAAKALQIAGRELAQGPAAVQAERAGLAALLGRDGSLAVLNAELCARLRENRIALDDPALRAHLRRCVLARLAIDNPEFPLYRAALAREHPSTRGQA